MTRIRLGTRRSRLALIQSSWVSEQIQNASPNVAVDLVEISTSGDRLSGVPLGPGVGQSFFTREIEEALRSGAIDLAVHSCKDLATELPEGLMLGAIPSREDPRDAVVSAWGRLDQLAPGSRVGTSSPRRKSFLTAAYPHLVFSDQRGNVPTRIDAVDRGDYHATILAVAGLNRLQMSERITEILTPDRLLPAAAQGALAVEVRRNDRRMRDIVAPLDDSVSRSEVEAERSCLRSLGAGCQAPVGVLGRVEGERLQLDVAVMDLNVAVRKQGSGRSDDAESIGCEVAKDLLEALRLDSLRDYRWIGSTDGMGTV